MQRNIERKNEKKQAARHKAFRSSSIYKLSLIGEKSRFLFLKNRRLCAFRSSLIYRQSPIREKRRFLSNKDRQLCTWTACAKFTSFRRKTRPFRQIKPNLKNRLKETACTKFTSFRKKTRPFRKIMPKTVD